MPWILLVVAGGLEVIWARGLSESHGFSSLLPSLTTVAALLGGFALLGWAIRSSKRGAAATLCTAIGALGVVLTAAFWLGQGMSLFQIASMMMITGGIVGLQLMVKSEHRDTGQHR